MIRRFVLLAGPALLGSCGPVAEDKESPPAVAIAEAPPAPASPRSVPTSPAALPTPTRVVAALLGEATVRREWARAGNRAWCAPLALTKAADAAGTPRRAHFSGGWAVAFDLPGLRSAYGVAGVGALDDDDAPEAERRAALARQWPYVRQLDAPPAVLPVGSVAGYGLEGAASYAEDNPTGKGEHSVAYVRVAGQKCLYNLWSRLGRSHLETMLDSLTLVKPES